MVEFKMTVLKTFQHDPLGRQCAEALRIKSIEPSKRINNRKEYHQPGDVEVRYEKNESEERKMKRKLIREAKEKENRAEKSLNIEVTAEITEETNELKSVNETVRATTVEDFIKQMMRNTVKNVDDDVVEDVCSTQNMIGDARARKDGQRVQQCDQCEYNTASKAMLRMHRRTKHKEVEHETQKEVIVGDKVLNENIEEKRKKEKTIKYIRKRIECQQCEKKFNKASRYNEHKKTFHEGMAKDVSTSKEDSIKDTTIELINSNDLTPLTLPYHLRSSRVTQKAEPAVQSPSV